MKRAHSAVAPPESTRHPAGLSVCFGTELWERFCFYGMRALLVLFFTSEACAFRMPQAEASRVYGAYLALIYATNVFGGLIADKLLGFRRAVILGGLLMSAGEFLLLVNDKTAFFGGLALLIVGCGLLKPNVSAILGNLYRPGDPRRDSGFTIFYMGINLGAFLGPIVCGWFASPTVGFAAAGVGMIVGVVYFMLRMREYGEHGLPPAEVPAVRAGWLTVLYIGLMLPAAYFLLDRESVGAGDGGRIDLLGGALNVLATMFVLFFLGLGIKEGKEQLGRMIALIFLLVANAGFWACFEQAGNSMNLFAETNVNRQIFGWEMPTAWGQSINAVFIILLAVPFSALWLWLERRRLNPPAPVKFSLGLLQVGLGFYVLYLGQQFATNGVTPLVFLVLCYLLHTTGELCLSPVGLSTMTKLAPPRFGGLVMGGWFLSTAYGNHVAGVISALAGRSGDVSTETLQPAEALPVYMDVFWLLTQFGMWMGLGALVLSPLIARFMRGVK